MQLPPKPVQFARIEQQNFRRSETVDSFVSAKESPVSRPSAEDNASLQLDELEKTSSARKDASMAPSQLQALPEDEDITEGPGMTQITSGNDSALVGGQLQTDPPFDPPSPARTVSDDLSEASSPERPILRKKSSLTFATLPTRDTILPKKSMGAVNARTSYAESGRSTQVALKPTEPEQSLPKRRSSRRQSNHDVQNQQTTEHEPETDSMVPSRTESSEVSKEHNKTSTQRLHERITMLGKMNPHRPSKSISATATGSQPSSIESIFNGEKLSEPVEAREEDSDWIEPIMTKGPASAAVSTANNERPSMFLPQKDVSFFPEPEDDIIRAPHLESTSKPVSFQSARTAYPDLSALAAASTTPAGSPVRNHTYAENPLSASKAKLFDMFKSARSIFASSAGTSAQAKMQIIPPQGVQPKSSPESDNEDDEPPPVSQALEASREEPVQVNQASGAPKSRRSSARIQQQKEQRDPDTEVQHMEIDVQEMQVQTVAKAATDAKPSELKKTALATSQMSKHGELRRPGPKQAPDTQAKGRPAPVSIRVASQRVGQGAPSTTALGSTLHESLSQSTQQRPPPTLKTKGSNSSIKSGLTGTIGKGSAAAASRPKALEAAARKKEQVCCFSLQAMILY